MCGGPGVELMAAGKFRHHEVILTASGEGKGTAQLEAAHITLTTNIVLAVVQEGSLRGQIVATEKIIKLVRDSLGILRQQRALGQIAEADVVAQEAALAQIEQTLPPLQRQLGNNGTLSQR